MRRGERMAVQLRPAAAAAPDEVRLHPDGGVAAAGGATLDALEQEAVRLAMGELQEGADRGIEIRHPLPPQHLAVPRGKTCAEGGEIGKRHWSGSSTAPPF
jgi:hypothetical protein